MVHFYTTPYSLKDVVIYSSNDEFSDKTIYEEKPIESFTLEVLDNDPQLDQLFEFNIYLRHLDSMMDVLSNTFTIVASMFKSMIPCYKYFIGKVVTVGEIFDITNKQYTVNLSFCGSANGEEIAKWQEELNYLISDLVTEPIHIKMVDNKLMITLQLKETCIYDTCRNRMELLGTYIVTNIIPIKIKKERLSSLYVCSNCFKKLYKTEILTDKIIFGNGHTMFINDFHKCCDGKGRFICIDEDLYDLAKYLHEHNIELENASAGRLCMVDLNFKRGNSSLLMHEALQRLKESGSEKYKLFESKFNVYGELYRLIPTCNIFSNLSYIEDNESGRKKVIMELTEILKEALELTA